MSAFFKTECPHCGQTIEFLSEGAGQSVPCPTCEKPFVLTSANPSTSLGPIVIPPAPVQEIGREQKFVRSNLSKLTEETIRARTKAGDTPLHRAAKNGQLDLIPSHLLSSELFMAKNHAGDTPLHLAAKFGTLNRVPPQFLTKETLTIPQSPHYAPNGFHITGLGYKAQSPTVLHIAARCGHADQIPKEFLTPEFLLIEATGYRLTVLQEIVESGRLDVVQENVCNSTLWNLRNNNGQTPREILEGLIENQTQRETLRTESQANLARVRSEPATEKQKEKLSYFGYAFGEGISKGQASDALDQCAADFPEKNQAYYDRPATDEQLTKIRRINARCEPDEQLYDFDGEGPLTYGEAKELFQDLEMWEREQIAASDLGDCVDSYWEEHHWDDDYEESERGQFDSACLQILEGWDFEKHGALPKRKQVAEAWELVKSRKSKKTMLPKQSELVATLVELFSKFRP